MMVTSRTIRGTSVQVLMPTRGRSPFGARITPTARYRAADQRGSVGLSNRDTTAVEPVGRPENKNPIR